MVDEREGGTPESIEKFDIEALAMKQRAHEEEIAVKKHQAAEQAQQRAQAAESLKNYHDLARERQKVGEQVHEQGVSPDRYQETKATVEQQTTTKDEKEVARAAIEEEVQKQRTLLTQIKSLVSAGQSEAAEIIEAKQRVQERVATLEGDMHVATQEITEAQRQIETGTRELESYDKTFGQLQQIEDQITELYANPDMALLLEKEAETEDQARNKFVDQAVEILEVSGQHEEIKGEHRRQFVRRVLHQFIQDTLDYRRIELEIPDIYHETESVLLSRRKLSPEEQEQRVKKRIEQEDRLTSEIKLDFEAMLAGMRNNNNFFNQVCYDAQQHRNQISGYSEQRREGYLRGMFLRNLVAGGSSYHTSPKNAISELLAIHNINLRTSGQGGQIHVEAARIITTHLETFNLVKAHAAGNILGGRPYAVDYPHSVISGIIRLGQDTNNSDWDDDLQQVGFVSAKYGTDRAIAPIYPREWTSSLTGRERVKVVTNLYRREYEDTQSYAQEVRLATIEQYQKDITALEESVATLTQEVRLRRETKATASQKYNILNRRDQTERQRQQIHLDLQSCQNQIHNTRFDLEYAGFFAKRGLRKQEQELTAQEKRLAQDEASLQLTLDQLDATLKQIETYESREREKPIYQIETKLEKLQDRLRQLDQDLTEMSQAASASS